MKGLGILILIVLFFWLVWPVISRWLKRKAVEKAQDYFFRNMGMEPPKSRNKKSAKRKQESTRDTNNYRKRKSGPIIPKEYAEDVEFIEIKEYSETSIKYSTEDYSKIYHESQVSDAEWVEIKSSRSK